MPTSATPRRIGLYGGSFDPVHLGHLLVAQAACEELKLDRLFFVPAAQSPFKPGTQPAPAALRLRWLRLALANCANYEVDDQEVHRGGVSFTIDTVRGYASRFPESALYYLIGADHVRKLPQWRAAEELAGLLEFVVIPRPGEASAAAPAPFRLHRLRGFPVAVSSSVLRARCREGVCIRHLVPPGVGEAIRETRVYSGTAN